MHPLFEYINRYSFLSEEDFPVLLDHFIPKKIKKRQYLLQEGEICKHLAFIIKGAMRKYHVDDKGAEHVVDLYIEDWWAGDRESWIMDTYSIYNIEACEDCELLLISRANKTKLCKQVPAFNELVVKLDERNAISSQRRITASISLPAEKRYADFIDSHPHFAQRFPQHVIASYLGITKDTLSRVRKKAFRD
ncbi:MAG: Crp/Fnr family transcriptional regulator [Chitinophagaceae bacterium]|nr:MAG: Crp/Fnr family transcriptional regulator [Chitinophagaceae bacterium]